MDSTSTLLHREPCPQCHSKDNLARYSDGHAYCFGFGCEYYEPPNADWDSSTESRPTTSNIKTDFLQGSYKALPSRHLSDETCKLYGYKVGKNRSGKTVQIAPFYQDGKLVAQKLRTKDKDFTVIGSMKTQPLFGQALVPKGGKKLVITEGEIDAMSISQVFSNKYPATSLPNGAASAKKTLAENLEYLQSFEEVILAFDMDEAGQGAAKQVCEVLLGVNFKIAELPAKDANECLKKGMEDELRKAIWNASTYQPDGLLNLSDIIDEVQKPIEMGFPWFLPTLTKHTYGRRLGEVYTIGAGTGVGKTDLLTQSIAFDVQNLQQKVGVFFLEQGVNETGKRIAGKIKGKLFHLPPEGRWKPEELKDALSEHWVQKVSLYDSFGVSAWESIKPKLTYLASQGTKLFYLDHLTALATGRDEDEKKVLEEVMADIAKTAKALNIIVHLVSHLTTPDKGSSHEEGGRVTIRQFKGSRAIGFWSFVMFGLERHQQHDDEYERQITTLRILKERQTGQAVGQTIRLKYDPETGLLKEEDEFEGYGFEAKKEKQNEENEDF